MKEQLISFKTAKLAYEKGFHEDVKVYYNKAFKGANYQVPTQSLLQKWLREKHNILVEVRDGVYGWWYLLYEKSLPANSIVDNNYFKSYEEALEFGLFEALKLIKE